MEERRFLPMADARDLRAAEAMNAALLNNNPHTVAHTTLRVYRSSLFHRCTSLASARDSHRLRCYTVRKHQILREAEPLRDDGETSVRGTNPADEYASIHAFRL